jgi:hypothetical protein
MKYPSRFTLGVVFLGLVACGASGATQHPEAASHSPNEHTHAEGRTANSSNATSKTSPPGLEVSPEERAAYEKARPLFETYCAKCHTTQGAKATAEALEHFGMDAYPFRRASRCGNHGDDSRSLGATGSKPSMPRDKPGAVRERTCA